eukprot:snap_masked-scaffold_20-processed-gene-5.105-mRNA-1 protein AED:1.00 eAED:1.00 QI:0/0/0/0/1/1/4/0/63
MESDQQNEPDFLFIALVYNWINQGYFEQTPFFLSIMFFLKYLTLNDIFIGVKTSLKFIKAFFY